MAANRKTVRERFAALLDSGVTSAVAVYDHQPGTFDKQSPVITVGSGGSDRTRMTFRGGQTVVQLDVHLFVRVAEAGSATYTQAQAEDLLDDCEQQIATVVEDHQKDADGGWKTADYAAPSEPVFVMVDGVEYKRERIPINLTVFA